MHTAAPSIGEPQQLLECMKKHRFKDGMSSKSMAACGSVLVLQQITAPQNRHTQSSFFFSDDSEQMQQLERLCSHSSS
jgi:hypothetical protein